MLARLPRPLRAPLRAGSTLAWTALILAVVEVHKQTVRVDEREAVFERWQRRWSRGVHELMGSHLQIFPGPPAPATRARLVVCNHRSVLDTPILMSQFAGSALSRADLASWPVVGLAARRAQVIFVDRDSPRSGVDAIRGIREQLQRGRTVCLFPEGTTYEGDEVRPFNPGAFAAARNLDVEFVPVGLAYPTGTEFTQDSFFDHASKVVGRKNTRVGMAIGEGGSLEGRANAKAEQMREAVQELVHRARRMVDEDGG